MPLSLTKKAKQYFRRNLGAPFIIAFMVLLISSAAELSLGLTDVANEIAVYAFYALTIGVGLQILSYVKYGEEEISPTPLPTQPKEKRRMSRREKVIALSSITILVSFTAAAIYIYYPAFITYLPHQTYPKLVVHLSFNTTLVEPDGSKVIIFGLSVIGGKMPYNFTAIWGDNFTQTEPTGVFRRTFAQGVAVPSYAIVHVESSDGQNANLTIAIHPTKE